MKIITTPTARVVSEFARRINVHVSGVTFFLASSAQLFSENYSSPSHFSNEEGPAIVLSPYYASLYRKYEEFITDPTKEDLTGFDDFDIDEFNLVVSHISSIELAYDAYERSTVWMRKQNPLQLPDGEIDQWLYGEHRGMLPACHASDMSMFGWPVDYKEAIMSWSSTASSDEERRLAGVVYDLMAEKFPDSMIADEITEERDFRIFNYTKNSAYTSHFSNPCSEISLDSFTMHRVPESD